MDMVVGVTACSIIVIVALWLVERTVREESHRWRRLIQLYMEKQLNAPLPVDTDEDGETGSSLHLPAEELEELEREDEEEEALRKQRLT